MHGLSKHKLNPIIHLQVMIVGLGPSLAFLMTVKQHFDGMCFWCTLRWSTVVNAGIPHPISSLSLGPTAASVAREDGGVSNLFKKPFKFGRTDVSRTEDAAAGDIEAPPGSRGIALTNLARDQQPGAGAPPVTRL